MRVLVGSDIDIVSPVFVGADGETPADCDALPTVAVTGAVGGVMAAPVVTSSGVTGRYRAALTASPHAVALDVLTVVWLGVVGGKTRRYIDTVEVVGGHYASIPELRALPDMGDPLRVTSDRLRQHRDAFAELVEEYRGASWVPRVTVETHPGGSRGLALDRLHIIEVLSVTADGTAADLTGHIVDGAGVLTLVIQPWGSAAKVVVVYTYGRQAVPASLARACREYVRSSMLADTGGIPNNALSYSDGNGITYRTSTADWSAGRPTGLMVVDQLLNEVPDFRFLGVA